MPADNHYEIYAIRYAEKTDRLRGENFIVDDDHASPMPMDYSIWLARNDSRTILIDTGFDGREAQARNRPILVEPAAALAEIGVRADDIDAIVLTHLHYDHAGGLNQFPGVPMHMQETEMAYATGPCMCYDALRGAYTADHVCDAVKRVYSGLVTFHDGDAGIAPGITGHLIGGHTSGLQAVRIETASGPVVLASDTAHYYENFERYKPFTIVADVADMLRGFDRLRDLAGPGSRIVPGHDPLVRQRFPRAFDGAQADIRRLDLPDAG